MMDRDSIAVITLMMGMIALLSSVIVFDVRVTYVVGDSMSSDFHGRNICYDPLDGYEVGDVVSYTYGDRRIVHRIIDSNEYNISMRKGWYMVKGDNNKHPDAPVHENQIECKLKDR